MKALLLLLAAIFVAGCDMDKALSLQGKPTPTPVPRATPTPTPKPKAGDWMGLKQYKSPLDQRPGHK